MQFRNAISTLFSSESPTTLNLRSGSVENPAVPLQSPATFNMIFGGGEPTASGESVSEANALTISTVFACTRLIAESVAGIPLKVLQRTDNGRTEASSHSLAPLLSISPNPDMSAHTFFENLAGCLALTGNSYAWIQRDTVGNVLALWPLHPLRTEVLRDSTTGLLVYRTSDGMAEGETRLLPAKDVIHVPLFSFDGLKGISPVQMARQTLGLSQATLKQGARYFANGSRPGGLLTPKAQLNAQQAEQMKQFWEQQASGINQGRVAVLPSDWAYTALGVSLEDSQFLASREFSRDEIASQIFHIDPHFVGSTVRQSNANAQQQSLALYQTTLAPYLRKIEQELMRKLLPPTGKQQSSFYFEFDLSDLLRTDLKTTLEALAVGRQWGLMTANEGRRQLGLNSVGPEGDVLYSPINMMNSALFPDWTPGAVPVPKENKDA